MAEKEVKPEVASMQVFSEVKKICEEYRELASMQGKNMTLAKAHSIIYAPSIDVAKISKASASLNKIRQQAITDNKEVLKSLEL